MTIAQTKAIERLRRSAESTLFFGGPEKYEFKKFEIEETDYGPVWLTIETGMIGDEHTLAVALSRDHCFIGIGKRGGVFWYKRTKSGKDVRKAMGRFDSVLTAVCDQNIR